MLPLIIIWPTKIWSFANGYRSISGRARHVIVVKIQSVIGALIMLFPFLLPFVRDLLFKWGVVIFAWGGILFAFFVLCLKFLYLGLSFSSFFMSSSMIGAMEVPVMETSSTTIVLPSLSSSGGVTLPSFLVFDIFSPND
jgi:hypothetical protein